MSDAEHALTELLAALTDAVDRLTRRIDALEAGSPCAAPLDFDADPFAWPSEAELVRYLADRAPGDNC